MCKIKNDFSETLLKDLRALDKGEINASTDKADVLARIKFMQEALEEYESLLKADLKDTLKETVFLPEIGKKVLLAEGRKTSEYDVQEIQRQVPPAVFTQIVNVVKKKVDEMNDRLISDLVQRNTIEHFGAPYITVSKMNKQELIEQKG